MKDSYSLYIHIPFCKKKCNYCDFVSYEGMEHLIPEYFKALRSELNFYSRFLDKPIIKTIYFGGGTPSIVKAEEIEKILKYVDDIFVVLQNAEITLEGNPETLDFKKLKRLKSAGVNRLSIGAQTFNDSFLKILGRIHSSGTILKAYEFARKAGFKNINIDLIFALPNQKFEDLKKDISQVLELNPDHISTYNLTIEKGTPLYKIRKKLNIHEEDEYKMFKYIISSLKSAGYKHYEISNFSKPGRMCKHNLTYWENNEYIGVGAGATSYISGARFSNKKAISKYINDWQNKNRPKYLLQRLKHPHKNLKMELSDAIFLGLRKMDGINTEKLYERYGFNIFYIYKNEIDELKKNGLIKISKQNIKLSSKGIFLANEVFEKFI